MTGLTNKNHNVMGYTLGRVMGVIVAAVMLLAGGAMAAVLTVGASGMNYTMIQDAIDNASTGDTVFVHNGTYIEQVSITKNNLSIIGEDRNTTIIHGRWSADRVVDISRQRLFQRFYCS